jgi:hypothetical protein
MNNDHIVRQETKGEFTLKIVSDDSCENPYTNYDCLTDLVTWHRRMDFSTKERSFDAPEDVVEAFKAGDIVYYSPLYAYEHDGITVRLGDRGGYPFTDIWDSGLLGMVFVTKAKAQREWPKLAHRTLWLACERVARSEVANFDDYLTGNCYGFTIENGKEELIESYWGFLGNWDGYILSGARETLQAIYRATPEQKELPFMTLAETY